jgi:hypothetical protein
MESDIERLERRLEALEARLRSARRRARLAGLAVAFAAVGLGTGPSAHAQFGLTLAGLHSRLMAVEAKTAPMSLQGTDLAFTGVNVHIRDGSGSTFSDSGLGNLTVGYNRARGAGRDVRTGTHNLVLGDFQNYSGFGGLVAGSVNAISGGYSTVGGGNNNVASGQCAAVGGGLNNTASGVSSSVSGGARNNASGSFSSVSGGLFNTAGGESSAVSGGANRSATEKTD